MVKLSIISSITDALYRYYRLRELKCGFKKCVSFAVIYMIISALLKYKITDLHFSIFNFF